MVLLFMIFILAGSGQLSRKIEGAFQDEHARSMASIIAKIDEKVRQYLVTKTLVSAGTGGLSALILWIIGVDFPLLWGFITFLFNYIPNFGSLLSTVFPVILALVQFDTPTPALVALVLLVVMQNIMGNILEPRIMAFSLNLSPVLVLVSLIFWGWLWGVVGMILAVPIMSMIKIVFEHIDTLKPVAALMSSGDVRA
jgi:AI-2 transport protein TqsA